MTNSMSQIESLLTMSAEDLHKILSVIFPTQSRRKKGDRLKGLLYIRRCGRVERGNDLKRHFGMGSRQGLYEVLKSLIDAGVLDEQGRNIVLTLKGKKLLDALFSFQSSMAGTTKIQPEIKAPNVPFYNSLQVILFTNGKNPANYLWVWDITNNGKSSLERLTYKVRSGGTPLEKFLLIHSKEILSYELRIDEPDFKVFDLLFDGPINPRSQKKYWYSYEWPGNYDPLWRPWDFTFIHSDFVISDLLITIINPPSIEVKSKTVDSNFEVQSEDTILGKFQSLGVDYYRTPYLNFIQYRARNVPTKATIKIKWDFEYRE